MLQVCAIHYQERNGIGFSAEAITSYYLANKKMILLLAFLGFVGRKNGFNPRQINYTIKPFLLLTKAMQILPI